MNIYEKLSIIQTKLKAPKGLYNSFGKYHYRSTENILEALKPILAEVKATIIITDTIEQVGDRYYIKALAALHDAENIESYPITVSAYAREDEKKTGMDLAQLTGSCSSYARKYALNGLFALDNSELDPDSTNQHGKGETAETRTKTQTKAPDKQKAQSFDSSKMATVLQNTAKGLGMTEEELLSFAEAEYRVQTLEQLTREQGLALLTTMKQYPKKEDN